MPSNYCNIRLYVSSIQLILNSVTVAEAEGDTEEEGDMEIEGVGDTEGEEEILGLGELEANGSAGHSPYSQSYMHTAYNRMAP